MRRYEDASKAHTGVDDFIDLSVLVNINYSSFRIFVSEIMVYYKAVFSIDSGRRFGLCAESPL